MKEDTTLDFFESGIMNRSAILVRPKLPLLEWLNTVQSHDPLEFKDVNRSAIYLIDEKDGVTKIENWLKRNFKEIFCRELFCWHTITSDYPENINFKLFKEWFDYELCDSISDIGEDELKIY
jgi:hypothetical protein